MPRIAVTPEKVRVLLTEGKGLEIDWADGHKSAWSFAWLREACPCATCVEQRNAGRPQAGPAEAEARRRCCPCTRRRPSRPARMPWAATHIQFNWQDGHSSGIYSWEYLRRVCQCQECTFAEAETAGTPN